MKKTARWFWAVPDPENSCERCWEALLTDIKREGLPEPNLGFGPFQAPISWRRRRCPHGAPEFAPGIILPAPEKPRRTGRNDE